MTPRYPRASVEPLDIIRANECESAHDLATSRFQALWNEIERLRAEIAAVLDGPLILRLHSREPGLDMLRGLCFSDTGWTSEGDEMKSIVFTEPHGLLIRKIGHAVELRRIAVPGRPEGVSR